jgi:hypothetical protein
VSIAASLLVTLKADTERLRADLDKANAKIAQFSRNAESSTGRASAGFERMGLGAEKAGMAFGRVVTGALMMSGALDGVSKTGQLAGHTLGAFLAGGPIAAGVVGLTGAFQLLAEQTAKSREAAATAEKAYASMLAEVRKGADEAEKRLDDLGMKARVAGLKSMGIDIPEGVLSKDKLAGELRMQALNEQDRLNGLFRMLDQLLSAGNIPEFLKQNAMVNTERQRIEELNAARIRHAEALEREIDATEEIQNIETGANRPVGGGQPTRQMEVRTAMDGSQWWLRGPGDWVRVNSDEQVRILKSIDSKLGGLGRMVR